MIQISHVHVHVGPEQSLSWINHSLTQVMNHNWICNASSKKHYSTKCMPPVVHNYVYGWLENLIG